MGNKDKVITIVISILIVNALGFLLRLNKLDDYLILAGFRFHLSFIIPFLLAFRISNLADQKQILLKPGYNKTFQPLFWIFFPLIIILAGLYFIKKIEIGDPDYFYEFGLSSIFDLPLYLIWNLPQLLMLASFLILVQKNESTKFLTTSAIVFLLFVFELVPVDKSKIIFPDIAVLLFSSLSAGLILRYFRNVYWFGIIFFMIFWLNLLAFGSNSPALIHILFASHYESWEGFFEANKSAAPYLLAAQTAIAFLLLSVSVVFIKRKN